MTDTPKVITTHQLLAGLPEYLKTPEAYRKVMKALLDTIATTHSHAEIKEWMDCTSCKRKAMERRELMKQLGFKSVPQFMAWRKIHEYMSDTKLINRRDPLPMYNS